MTVTDEQAIEIMRAQGETDERIAEYLGIEIPPEPAPEADEEDQQYLGVQVSPPDPESESDAQDAQPARRSSSKK